MEYKHKKEDAQRESGRALNKAQYLLENFKRGKAVAYSEYDKINEIKMLTVDFLKYDYYC